jgi:peptidoglycan/LPS O-acetylase OafA/YrhL
MREERTGSYIGGLSGFRAIAALLVILYHLHFPYASGGLLGVTAFFTVSGFLVTRNLFKEAERNGRIDLLQFMKKRLLRIMPALFFMCTVTVILFAGFNRALFTKEARDLFSTLTGWNNWHQIFSNVSYFENAGAPSPLTHTWSLSLEMQFYAIIGLLFFFIGKSEIRRPLLQGITAAGALISVTLMVALFDPSSDPTRVYYGTDTRLFSLLAGSLLALSEEDVRRLGRNHLLSGLTGLVSLCGFIAMAALIPGYSIFMFRGGQIIATVLCAAVIAACMNDSLFTKVLGNPDAHPFYGAPTVIVVLADEKYFTHVYDGSLVMGNLLNAAHSLDIGACWIHRAKEVFESEDGKALLRKWGIPDGYEGIGNCVIGYRDCDFPLPKEKKTDYIYRV